MTPFGGVVNFKSNDVAPVNSNKPPTKSKIDISKNSKTSDSTSSVKLKTTSKTTDFDSFLLDLDSTKKKSKEEKQVATSNHKKTLVINIQMSSVNLYQLFFLFLQYKKNTFE